MVELNWGEELIHAVTLTFTQSLTGDFNKSPRILPAFDCLEFKGICYLQRFFDRVEAKEGGCWEWIGHLNHHGYGMMSVDYRQYPAHRISYFMHFGIDPQRFVLLHACDNPPCVNPLHLHLGTQGDNVRDCAAKGRIGHGPRHGTKTCPERYRGENSSHAKITDQQVIEIRKMYIPGIISQRTIAEMYGLCQQTVHEIITNQIWKHLPAREELLYGRSN